MKRLHLFVERLCFVGVLFNVTLLLLCILTILGYTAHAEEPDAASVPAKPSASQAQVVHMPRTVVLEALCVRNIYSDKSIYNAVVDGILIDTDKCMPFDEFLFRINCVPMDVRFEQREFDTVNIRTRYRYIVTCTD